MTTNITQLPRSGTVKANGQELYYETHGEGPALLSGDGNRVRLVTVDAGAGSGPVHRSSRW